MKLEILKRIGLSNGEIKTYLALLELGPTPLNAIYVKTGITRRNLYDILQKLIEKGMASYIYDNKHRIFQASDPDKIIHYLEQKEEELRKVKADTQDAIPELKEKFLALRPETNGEIFRGIEGVKTVWEDTINYKESFWIGSGNYVPKKYPHFYNTWTRKRIERKSKRYNLYRDEIRGEIIENKYTYYRFLPPHFSPNPLVICIYGNKVAHMMLGEELFVFVIESKEASENYRKYFQYLWNNSAKK